MWDFADLRIANPNFFVICGFVISGYKFPQVRKYIHFLHKNIVYKYNALIQICTILKNSFKKTTFRTVRQSCAVFCRNLRI
jgi:hypothetical protein